MDREFSSAVHEGGVQRSGSKVYSKFSEHGCPSALMYPGFKFVQALVYLRNAPIEHLWACVELCEGPGLAMNPEGSWARSIACGVCLTLNILSFVFVSRIRRQSCLACRLVGHLRKASIKAWPMARRKKVS